jgi:hypothetical protein
MGKVIVRQGAWHRRLQKDSPLAPSGTKWPLGPNSATPPSYTYIAAHLPPQELFSFASPCLRFSIFFCFYFRQALRSGWSKRTLYFLLYIVSWLILRPKSSLLSTTFSLSAFVDQSYPLQKTNTIYYHLHIFNFQDLFCHHVCCSCRHPT